MEEFHNEQELRKIWGRMTWFAIAALVLTVPVMWLWKFKVIPDTWCTQLLIAVIVTGWAVGPPLWFTYENHVLISDSDKQHRPKRVAQYKLGLDVAKAFWLAVAALIVSTLFKK